MYQKFLIIAFSCIEDAEAVAVFIRNYFCFVFNSLVEAQAFKKFCIKNPWAIRTSAHWKSSSFFRT